VTSHQAAGRQRVFETALEAGVGREEEEKVPNTDFSYLIFNKYLSILEIKESDNI